MRKAQRGVPVLNLAAAGDAVRDMRGVAQRQRLIDCLRARVQKDHISAP